MSTLKLKSMAAALSLAFTAGANAASIGVEGLFFSAWNGNENAPNSIVINLGETTSDFRANAMSPRSLSGESLTALSTWLGSLGSDLASTRWNVFGFANGPSGSPTFGGLSTATNITSLPNNDWGLFVLENVKGFTDNFRTVVANPRLTNSNVATDQSANLLYFAGQTAGVNFNSLGGLGDSLPFYAFFADQSGNEFFEGDFANLPGDGSWKLTFDGSVASLSYAPVPLPAGVWLLGSALAGLAASRRRST